MRAEVLNMKEVNMDFNKRLMDTEIFCQNNSDTFDEIRQRNDMNSQQVTMLKNENQSLKSDLSQIKADFHNLKEDYLDLLKIKVYAGKPVVLRTCGAKAGGWADATRT